MGPATQVIKAQGTGAPGVWDQPGQHEETAPWGILTK